ncbi:multiple sugar transport system substrate-binding protein [Hydrogenispora ethanolica]|uniref:Multiple sugar transport system substrate-binding protein n=1 Tax=Hydrogenispora ethanolica TaxID=1082276 RepID=A0A4R1RAW0_HYDET|nr:extracellular solute-binding protein [Hydrogenispora ethanolica]TCL62562.1 multiple sugar transport system substrate-binding protein [Hydrogenispora ethanolica]
MKRAINTLFLVLLIIMAGSCLVEAKEPVKLKAWMRATATENYLTLAAKRFNASQKDIVVDVQLQGENYGNALKMALAVNDAPDLFESNTAAGTSTVAQYAANKVIVPVDDIAKKLKANLDPGIFKCNDLFYQNKIYSVPAVKYFFQLVYNKDLFKKAGLSPNNPPKTLEEVREYAKKITAAGKGDFYGFGIGLGIGNYWWRTIDMMSVAADKSGAYGYDYRSGKFDFSGHKKYLDIFLGMKKDGSFYPGETTLGIEQLRSKFAEGKIGMYFDGSWTTALYGVTLAINSDWGFADVPVLKGETFKKGYAYYQGQMVINAASKNRAAAKKFYQFLVANADANYDFNIGPITYKSNVEPNPPQNKALFQYLQANESKYIPLRVEPHTAITLMGDNRDRVITDEFIKSYAGKGDFDKAIRELNKRYNDALEKALTDGILKKKEIKK